MSVELKAIERIEHRRRIEAWLRADHVAKWWGDPAVQLAQVDATPDDQHALIVAAGAPVGYLRWQIPPREALVALGLGDIPPGSIDVDIFIGDPENSGRGTGPQALRLLFERLRATTQAPLAGLCTSVDNHRAHAAFRKAGCILLTDYQDPTYGPCLVFVVYLR